MQEVFESWEGGRASWRMWQCRTVKERSEFKFTHTHEHTHTYVSSHLMLLFQIAFSFLDILFLPLINTNHLRKGSKD